MNARRFARIRWVGAVAGLLAVASCGDDNNNGDSARNGAFGWNAGLGVIVNDFRFDGSLAHGFVTGGPDFVGGTQPGFLAIASLTYDFDAARNPPPPKPVEVPVIAPAPAPVEPPPPPPPPAPAPPPEQIGWMAPSAAPAAAPAPSPAPAPAPPPARR